MPSPQLKICGMLHPENIREVAALQPDYLGFIFFKGSKRYAGTVLPETLDALPENIKKTGVFVNETLEMVLSLVHKYNLNALQLHGAESPEFCQELKLKLNTSGAQKVQLIKSFGVDEDFDFSQLNAYVGRVDYFLFDTQTPDHGGSGRQFDWQLLSKYTLETPYFLSGGIGLESAEMLNGIVDPRLFAIDVNSKFEIEPGLKDLSKLKEFKSKLT
ncbi:phosphoribosylanthranilate isomerase [Pedobacter gandavensis]|uniref:N-(5'-phosphoribosyl)anthranilate isomerase n=1 Tax=Pedobacter gandavensis TaxID=2679963 RepID=A0ABR6EVR8_9SPHI|nr:phosphoribosylanthranilate isomerase [Pedobacter gandavensis]MBB2149112.1 phosphoribosylanthranilate isomerase [Pedobacter gandavensis]